VKEETYELDDPYGEFWYEIMVSEKTDSRLLFWYNYYKEKGDKRSVYINELEYRGIKYD
jgi:hypothetical protein